MNNWFHHYFGIIHLINVEVYWQYFFVVLKPSETSSPISNPMRPRKRGKGTIWVFRPIQQLGRIFFGIALDISGIHQDPKTCRLWGEICFFNGSMEYIATLKWPHQKRIISERNHARRGLGPCLGLTIVNPADEYWDWDLKPQGLDGSITEAKLLNKRYPRICLDCSLDRRDSYAKPMDFGVFGVVFSSQPIWKSWQFWPWLLYHIVPPINP